jgi:hypothetical protein
MQNDANHHTKRNSLNYDRKMEEECKIMDDNFVMRWKPRGMLLAEN